MPLHWNMLHEESVRCRFIYNENGHGFEIDIPINDFNSLPIIEIE